jgi:hypothetical protein
VMLGSTDLNAEIAPCWKLVWNVEPAALMVPLTELALGLVEAPEAGVVVVPLAVVEELEEEHAARARAAATTPAVASCRLRGRCISGYSFYRFYRFFGRNEQPGMPVSLQTVVSEYSLSASPVLAGKCEMDKR